MVKIKRKVEMTKKELVQFLIENTEITEITQSTKNGEVFEQCIKIKTNNKLKRINDNLVEVEVEEEIDEGTVLPVFAMTYINAFDKIRVTSWENTSIKSVEKNHKALAYHFLNDDGTMTLIWKDGAMVD